MLSAIAALEKMKVGPLDMGQAWVREGGGKSEGGGARATSIDLFLNTGGRG